MRFEDSLARTIGTVLGATVLGACTLVPGGTDSGSDSGSDSGGTTTTPDLEAMCDGGVAPPGYELALGFVVVPPGTPCPDAPDAALQLNPCTFLEWQQITCALDHVDPNQVFVDDGYGGYYTDADTGSADVVDVCYYQGVFFDPEPSTVCGRPLIVEDRPVVARIVPGASGWAAGPAAASASLGSEDRRALAGWWLRSALLEHASVASFARCSLDLMRFGAPPELVEAAHRAALDEIRHAQVCFALAEGYAGRAVRPGSLAEEGLVAPAASLADLAEAVVREGCVGETLAAIDAAARLAGARDPAVRAALESIVRDESAHAALAWRTLRWILANDPHGELRDRAAAALASERERWTRVAGDEGASSVTAGHGLLTVDVRQRAFSRAWEEVILPAWEGLGSPQA